MLVVGPTPRPNAKSRIATSDIDNEPLRDRKYLLILDFDLNTHSVSTGRHWPSIAQSFLDGQMGDLRAFCE
jgi:hypothetical protein